MPMSNLNMRDKPKECVNNTCKNIMYVPYYNMHLLLECDKCVNERLMGHSELYGDMQSVTEMITPLEIGVTT